MRERKSMIRTVIIIIAAIIILTLIAQNIFNVFNFLGIKIPVLIAVIGIYAAGWFTSKEFDGSIDYNNLQKKYNELENTLAQTLDKWIKEAHKVGEKVKEASEGIGEQAQIVKDTVSKVASSAKDTAQDAAASIKKTASDAKQEVKKTTNTAKKSTRNTSAKRPTTNKNTSSKK